MIALLIITRLAQLFNKSLTLVFPNCWKEANVTPIFKKKGSATDPQIYRPISLLSILSKIFERLAIKQMYEHITSRGVFRGDTGRCPPLRRRRRPPTPPPPRMEKLVSGYCALKKVKRKIFMENVPKKYQLPKKSTKIALGTGGVLSTVRPLGLVPP